jgi:alkanesulfonate monooxygenase SsuD/methylene tetrahydromethanopterin reductase-like flavin-dependent oxidoreductase (luciferase family)
MAQVFAFHLMPYMDMPDDLHERYPSSWVTFPNVHYDPEKGKQYYNEYLDQFEYCEKMGFDGVVVNEHHQTAYGLMPSPNIMAAALARRTKNIKIAILGNAIPLRSHPQRIAEEVAMLDVITGGRIISGFVRGIGAEYYTFRLNPADSKARFYEAHDLIVRAWTEEGPFEFIGEHYQFRNVNVWPRPYQKPHPPIWLPSQGSRDTIEFAARKRYTYLQTLSSIKDLKESFDLYRAEAEKNGYTAKQEQLGWSVKIYVAETDEQAWKEAEEHIMYFFNNHFYMPKDFLFPPGYLSTESMQRVMKAKSGLGQPGRFTFEELVEKGYCVIGSPETVKRRIEEIHREVGFGILVAHMHSGNMPNYRVMKNIELFGRYVLPFVKQLEEKDSGAV